MVRVPCKHVVPPAEKYTACCCACLTHSLRLFASHYLEGGKVMCANRHQGPVPAKVLV